MLSFGARKFVRACVWKKSRSEPGRFNRSVAALIKRGEFVLIHVQKAAQANSSYEYGCDLRRVYPWENVAEPLWGSAIASVRPGEATIEHSHDEEETFFIISGAGIVTIDQESADVMAGDVIYLPRHSTHSVKNGSSVDHLVFMTIFWGSPEADERMARMVRAR